MKTIEQNLLHRPSSGRIDTISERRAEKYTSGALNHIFGIDAIHFRTIDCVMLDGGEDELIPGTWLYRPATSSMWSDRSRDTPFECVQFILSELVREAESETESEFA